MSFAGVLQVGKRQLDRARSHGSAARTARTKLPCSTHSTQIYTISDPSSGDYRGSRSYTSHPDRAPLSRGFRKRRELMRSKAEAAAELLAEKDDVAFEGIGKAKRDFRPETIIDEEPYKFSASWWSRPQWYRSIVAWHADSANANYMRFVASIMQLEGPFKMLPGPLRMLLGTLLSYYGPNRTTSEFRLSEILDWYDKEEANPYIPDLKGRIPEPQAKIMSWDQKLRVMKREDRKDFWRAFPPYESFLRLRGYAEPDPHISIDGNIFITNVANGSAVEDDLAYTRSEFSTKIFKAMLHAPLTKMLFGSFPSTWLDQTLEQAIKDREQERRSRTEPGSPDRAFKDLVLQHLPGWNHATHMFDYGRRDRVARVAAEEDELMARVPDTRDHIIAVPPHIEQLHRWRSMPDPIYSDFAFINRQAQVDSMDSFIQGDFVAAGNALPDRVRMDKEQLPRYQNPWMYYIDASEAHHDSITPHIDPLDHLHHTQNAQETPDFVRMLKDQPLIARILGFNIADKQERVAVNTWEHVVAQRKIVEEFEKKPFKSAWANSFGPLLNHARQFLDPTIYGPAALYHNFRFLMSYHSGDLSAEEKLARDSQSRAEYAPKVREAIDVFHKNYSVKEHVQSYVDVEKVKAKASAMMSGRGSTPPPKQRNNKPSGARQYSTATAPPSDKQPETPVIPPGAHIHKQANKVPPRPVVGERVERPKSLWDRFEGVMKRVGESVDSWWYKREEARLRHLKEYQHPMQRNHSEDQPHCVMYPANPDRSPSRLFLEWRLMRDRALKELEKEHAARKRLDPSYDPDKRPLAEIKQERTDMEMSWVLWYGMNWYDHMNPNYSPETKNYDPRNLPKLPEVVIDWAKVPEDIALMYQIMKQWDHIKDSNDLPPEYYEFVWLIQWFDEGYDDVELPERMEVLLLQQASEYMLPREAAAAHDWLMRKEAAQGNQFKLLFTGPLPSVPELEAAQQGLLPETNGEHAIYVVGKDEIPRELLVASGTAAVSEQVLVAAQKAEEVAKLAAAQAPKEPVKPAVQQPKRDEVDENDEDEDDEDDEEEEGEVEEAKKQKDIVAESKKRRRRMRSPSEDLADSMMANRREAGDSSTGLVLRDENASGGTAALASFFDSLSGAVALSGAKQHETASAKSAGARKIAKEMFNYVGEIVDFQNYIRKFFPLFDVTHWEKSMCHLLAQVTEDVMDQRFNLPRLLANTAVYNRWLEWAVQRRMRCFKMNLPLPHMMRMSAPTLTNVAMMDGIPFVTFQWDVTYRTYLRKDLNYKIGVRDKEKVERYTRKQLNADGRAVRRFKPYGPEFIPLAAPFSKVVYTNKVAQISCVVVVDVRTAQYGSIMAWNWNFMD